jgi:hypothetical protein
MKKYLFTTIIACCVLCLFCAQAFSKEFYVAKHIKESRLIETDELIDLMFRQQKLEAVNLLTISKNKLDSKHADQVNYYIKEICRNSFELINLIRSAKDKDEFERKTRYIIEIRNELLDSCGYVNFCLAGSLTSSINVLFLDKLIHGENVDSSILKENKLSLDNLFECFEISDTADGKLSNINYDDLKNSDPNNNSIIRLFKKNNIKINNTLTFEDWKNLEPGVQFHLGFNKDLLKESSFSVILYNWLFLLEQQYATNILFSAKQKDPMIFDHEAKRAKEELDTIVTPENTFMYRSQKRWSGRSVYDFFRKYKYFDSGTKSTTRFKKLLERSLLNY